MTFGPDIRDNADVRPVPVRRERTGKYENNSFLSSAFSSDFDRTVEKKNRFPVTHGYIFQLLLMKTVYIAVEKRV